MVGQFSLEVNRKDEPAVRRRPLLPSSKPAEMRAFYSGTDSHAPCLHKFFHRICGEHAMVVIFWQQARDELEWKPNWEPHRLKPHVVGGFDGMKSGAICFPYNATDTS